MSRASEPLIEEMLVYPIGDYFRWDDEHHQEPHTTPVEDCPICRWGCDVRDCDCAAARTR